jgi:hypothetical protein
VDEHTISPAGDPFYAAPHAHPSTEDQDQDHPHACNDGWVTIGYLVEDESGEEAEEFAQYLCRRCASSSKATSEGSENDG